jgi:hypothetical protein
VLEFAINEQRNLRNEISQLMPFVVMDEAIAPDEKPASWSLDAAATRNRVMVSELLRVDAPLDAPRQQITELIDEIARDTSARKHDLVVFRRVQRGTVAYLGTHEIRHLSIPGPGPRAKHSLWMNSVGSSIVSFVIQHSDPYIDELSAVRLRQWLECDPMDFRRCEENRGALLILDMKAARAVWHDAEHTCVSMLRRLSVVCRQKNEDPPCAPDRFAVYNSGAKNSPSIASLIRDASVRFAKPLHFPPHPSTPEPLHEPSAHPVCSTWLLERSRKQIIDIRVRSDHLHRLFWNTTAFRSIAQSVSSDAVPPHGAAEDSLTFDRLTQLLSAPDDATRPASGYSALFAGGRAPVDTVPSPRSPEAAPAPWQLRVSKHGAAALSLARGHGKSHVALKLYVAPGCSLCVQPMQHLDVVHMCLPPTGFTVGLVELGQAAADDEDRIPKALKGHVPLFAATNATHQMWSLPSPLRSASPSHVISLVDAMTNGSSIDVLRACVTRAVGGAISSRSIWRHHLLVE